MSQDKEDTSANYLSLGSYLNVLEDDDNRLMHIRSQAFLSPNNDESHANEELEAKRMFKFTIGDGEDRKFTYNKQGSSRDFNASEDLQKILIAKNAKSEPMTEMEEVNDCRMNESVTQSRRLWQTHPLFYTSHPDDSTKVTNADNELLNVLIEGCPINIETAINKKLMLGVYDTHHSVNIEAVDNNDCTCYEDGDNNKNNDNGQQHQRLEVNQKNGTYESIHTKVGDLFSQTQFSDGTSLQEQKVITNSTDTIPSINLYSPSPVISDSALYVRQPGISNMSNRLSQVCIAGAKGSISDDSHQSSTNKELTLERRQIQERLKNRKKSIKTFTNTRENPFSIHMDCLERLSQATGSAVDSFGLPEDVSTLSEITPQQYLQDYATRLSHMYKRNQALMDNNSEFRTLIYKIICSLLAQDEQVLSTPSITKIIDVVRNHLESTSRFYSTAMSSFGVLTINHSSQLLKKKMNSQRKSSLDSLSFTSSNSSGFNATNLAASTIKPTGFTNSLYTDSCFYQNYSTNIQLSNSTTLDAVWSYRLDHENKKAHQQYSTPSNSQRQKPVDFRRISSVSYNDEQLINDLCDNHENGTAYNLSTSKSPESPWKYEELSSECKHHSNHHTSQSSLEHNSIKLDPINDSSIDTIYDYKAQEFLLTNTIQSNREPHSDIGSEFEPKQQPSYVSADDYLSQPADYYSDNNTIPNFSYEDDKSSSSQCRDLNERQTINIASIRAELEWTLNKLINFELKYIWLTGKDTLRRAIRKIGVPNEIREKVWLIFIDQMIGTKYDATKLLEEASKTINEEEISSSLTRDEEIYSILKQIKLDVNRTMPGHKLFVDGAEGGIKLRRILVAYSIHVNRSIAYCQGFNFIVALLLSVFEGDEEKALRGFVCIVDHIFPSKFYFDHYLTGARADQFLLADFICDQLIQNPTTAERKMVEGVTSSITLNWFISLFHGAVPTLTRLTILDHFMLEGVKALFRFTMAILYLAFEITPPSNCDVFLTIRNTAKDMYDIKLLLSIVEHKIKLPKDSYFAIKRSFYMVQSSFNSDQFYMQSLSNDTSRQLVSNKPLSMQQPLETKPPAMSFITGVPLSAYQSGDYHQVNYNTNNSSINGGGVFGPRVCTSSDRTKVCIQNIGKLGRSHIKIIDANNKSNEQSLMSPLRNCLIIGISNCGKNIIVARQSSRRNFKTFQEHNLMFHVHGLCTEIFDGFYLEDCHLALILTHSGEIFKIDVSKCFADGLVKSTETLMLKGNNSISENEEVKLRLASIDVVTNLLWIYVECAESASNTILSNSQRSSSREKISSENLENKRNYRANNPFLSDWDETMPQKSESQARNNYQRKILIIDIITFDIFSAFTVHQSFGDIAKMRTSVVAFCQLRNPMSYQFSSRIVRIGPTGRYEHLLSFADVVDFMINVPESCKRKQEDLDMNHNKKISSTGQRYSSIKRLLARSTSLDHSEEDVDNNQNLKSDYATDQVNRVIPTPRTLTKYYRSLMRHHTAAVDEIETKKPNQMLPTNSKDQEKEDFCQKNESNKSASGSDHGQSSLSKLLMDYPCRAIITSYLGDVEDMMETNYIPANMAFIFRNGKIALFEFTESYAIHTRESQLDRYDYSKVIEVTKNGQDFIITILTIFDQLIKVVI